MHITNTNSRLVAISGFLGLTFFIFANFIQVFSKLNLGAALIQLGINLFVFMSWGRAFRENVEMTKDNIGLFKTILIALLEIMVCIVDFLTKGDTFKRTLLSKGFILAFGVIVPVILGTTTTIRVIIPFLLKTLSLL